MNRMQIQFWVLSYIVYCLADDSPPISNTLAFTHRQVKNHQKLNTQYMKIYKVKCMNTPLHQCATYTNNTKIYSIFVFIPNGLNHDWGAAMLSGEGHLTHGTSYLKTCCVKFISGDPNNSSKLFPQNWDGTCRSYPYSWKPFTRSRHGWWRPG